MEAKTTKKGGGARYSRRLRPLGGCRQDAHPLLAPLCPRQGHDAATGDAGHQHGSRACHYRRIHPRQRDGGLRRPATSRHLRPRSVLRRGPRRPHNPKRAAWCRTRRGSAAPPDTWVICILHLVLSGGRASRALASCCSTGRRKIGSEIYISHMYPPPHMYPSTHHISFYT